jgi:hypothetical protein
MYDPKLNGGRNSTRKIFGFILTLSKCCGFFCEKTLSFSQFGIFHKASWWGGANYTSVLPSNDHFNHPIGEFKGRCKPATEIVSPPSYYAYGSWTPFFQGVMVDPSRSRSCSRYQVTPLLGSLWQTTTPIHRRHRAFGCLSLTCIISGMH